jgi:hypothetical protein
MKTRIDPITGMPILVEDSVKVIGRGGGISGGSGSTSDATSTAKGVLKLTNDLGGTADLPTVVATHLAAPLPITQGGTGTTTGAMTLDGQAARSHIMARQTTANTNGNNFTIQASGATSAATNKNGGTASLVGGISTGSGSSQALIQVSGNGISGTADSAPQTRVTVQYSGTTIANRLAINSTLTSGAGFDMQPTAAVNANLSADITSGATSMQFDTVLQADGFTAGSFPSYFPFVIVLDSERITVTGITSGTISTSGTFTIVRSIRDGSGTATAAAAHFTGAIIQELRDDGYIIPGSGNGVLAINVANQSGPITIYLPPVGSGSGGFQPPQTGQFILITDAGAADNNQITIKDYFSGNIINEKIDIPYGSVLLQYSSANARYKRLARENSSSATRYGKVGGSLASHYIDAGNTSTTETDLYSDAQAVLAQGGDTIKFEYSGIYVGSTSSKRLKVYYAGTVIFDSTALAVASNQSWKVRGSVTNLSSATAVRCVVELEYSGGSIVSASPTFTEVTGITSGLANILKITGTASGVGAATNDIVAKTGLVEWVSG